MTEASFIIFQNEDTRMRFSLSPFPEKFTIEKNFSSLADSLSADRRIPVLGLGPDPNAIIMVSEINKELVLAFDSRRWKRFRVNWSEESNLQI